MSEKLLDDIIATSRDCEKALAVFDLDSTLFHVNPRNLAVLRAFAETPTYKTKYPEAVEILAEVKTLAETYHIREQIHHLGLGDQEKSFYEELFEFWKKRFFSDDFLDFDEPYPGAVQFTQELYKNGVHIMYLTGRDVGRMRIGTERSLTRWGFPFGKPNVELVLKPHRSMDDAEFKADYLSELREDHAPVWFFENEPQNIHLVEKKAPHVKIIFFESVHSGKGNEPGDHVPRINSFYWKKL